jgi:hypothetical protein
VSNSTSVFFLDSNVPIESLFCRFFKESEGVIIATSDEYENPVSVTSMRSWLAAWGKTTYAVGPLMPIGYGSNSVSSRGDTVVEKFLEKSLQKYGEKSVLFVSQIFLLFSIFSANLP